MILFLFFFKICWYWLENFKGMKDLFFWLFFRKMMVLLMGIGVLKLLKLLICIICILSIDGLFFCKVVVIVIFFVLEGGVGKLILFRYF